MKGLASFVMRGPSQAVMVTTVLAMLSLILPLLGILSAAAVGLVTLRQGAGAGLKISLFATIACGVMMGIAFGNPLPSLGFLLLQWLPLCLLGVMLRSNRSLSLTTQTALAFGVLAIVAQYLMFGDPVAQWKEQLQPLAEQFEQAGLFDSTQSGEVVERMAGWMAGVIAAGIFLQLAFSLFLARWWQALLFNPGGFREEFHSFRLQKAFAVLGIPVLVVLLVPAEQTPELARYLGLLLMAILFLQGLAVAHGSLAGRSSGQLWLVGLYFLLIVLMPQFVMVLTTIGLMDIWVDFRVRFAKK
ncbi:MAG: hypothetical protein OI74_06265 [Gammaproteobacteria bacterium (ex Lamellibrachia satsuma)]|nr:MAG: DUF2232 domain-containing protein [Gammaproteobacteria bacterium (ex Lamellibrachia satsuma)]RRS33938.1 MAG: hypothetical protein OI74_06265 [Gammaproteobacteria bacterium (ex Lamellibrachia satsuma)]RRS37496.1 MAG: hypothetical protein NV67_00955 [Gammaproteobacteria bacterium (ex Lamellibrachia satsuma)]